MAKQRKTVTKKTRFEVFKRDSFACQYCGESAPKVVLHIDHIQPVSKGGNEDILNLITSCFDCNMGKKDRLLSDDSAVNKQKTQLDELQKRREQIEMMLEWRQGLKSLDDLQLEIASDAWSEAVDGFSLSKTGLVNMRKLIKKFGLNLVLDGIDPATGYLRKKADGTYDPTSVELAFKRLGGICKISSEPEWKRELIHCKNIARKQLSYCDERKLMAWMEHIHANNWATTDELKSVVLTSSNWSTLCGRLEHIMGDDDASF